MENKSEPKLFIATKAIIVNTGKVLLLRESSVYEDGVNVAHYDFPGGRLKPGERFDEALRREVREETGLTIEIGKPVIVHEWRPVVRGEKWQIVAVFFECLPKSKIVKLGSDHDQYLWINPADYLQYPIIENLQPVFEAYLKREQETS